METGSTALPPALWVPVASVTQDAPDCRWSWTGRPGRAGENVAVADTEAPTAALPTSAREAFWSSVLTVRADVVVTGRPPAAGACTR